MAQFWREARGKEGPMGVRLGWLPLDSAPSAKNGRQCAGLRPALQPLLLPLAQRFRRKLLATPFAQVPESDSELRTQLLLVSAPLPRKNEFRGGMRGVSMECVEEKNPKPRARFIDRADMGCSSAAAPLQGEEKRPPRKAAATQDKANRGNRRRLEIDWG